MTQVRSYTRTVNGQTVEVSDYERADRPGSGGETAAEVNTAGGKSSGGTAGASISSGASTSTSNTGGSKPSVSTAGTKVDTAATGNVYIDGLPEKRRSDITDRLDDFNKVTQAIDTSGFSPAEKELWKTFYVWEGGTKPVPGSNTCAGIANGDAFRAARDKVAPDAALPKDLTLEQIPAAYHAMLDDKLKWAGGAHALEQIGDTGVAVFVGDSLMRAEYPWVTRRIQMAINRALSELGETFLAVDGKIGASSISALETITGNEKAQNAFCTSLQGFRNDQYRDGGDITRTNYLAEKCRR